MLPQPQQQRLPQEQLEQPQEQLLVLLLVLVLLEQPQEQLLVLLELLEQPQEQELEQEQHMGSSSLSQKYRDVSVRTILCSEGGCGALLTKLLLYKQRNA